jgi:DNA-binding response OmpR family regulator
MARRKSTLQANSTHTAAQVSEAAKVLVVDDDSRIIEVLSDILSFQGYQIAVASNGNSALDRVRVEKPQLVIMDVQLPDVDGIEVCRRLKVQNELGYLPIILMTGYSARGKRIDGLSAGADDFLGKPIDPAELIARVRSLLQAKNLYDQLEESRRKLEQRVSDRTQELQVANKRLMELNQVKDNILAIVSHELRTPLQKMKGGLDLLLHEELDEAHEKSLITMVDEAFELLNYRVEDVAILADPTDIRPRLTSLTDLITTAVEQVKRIERRDNYQIEIRVEKKPGPVMVDPQAMVRVLAHLIDNSVKFGDDKPVEVALTSTDSTAIVEISDKGKGLSQDYAKVLGTPFAQADMSATRRYNGMGLGLALVKMICDAHEVGLSFQTKLNHGTTVRLEIALAKTAIEKSID